MRWFDHSPSYPCTHWLRALWVWLLCWLLWPSSSVCGSAIKPFWSLLYLCVAGSTQVTTATPYLVSIWCLHNVALWLIALLEDNCWVPCSSVFVPVLCHYLCTYHSLCQRMICFSALLHIFQSWIIQASLAVGSLLIRLHISVLLLIHQPGSSLGVSHTGRSSVHRLAC